MSEYLVNVLLDIDANGVTDEMTSEAADLGAALDLIRQAVQYRPDFRAITLLHIEDAPRMMTGATARATSEEAGDA